MYLGQPVSYQLKQLFKTVEHNLRGNITLARNIIFAAINNNLPGLVRKDNVVSISYYVR